jgi:membrane-associated protease RseP (regulator of RpoE activity)
VEILWTVVGAIAFFLLIMVSVALHEVGHMVPAKIFGVKVPQYFVGFGPKIFSFRRGETEYGVKWFILGGYVRLLGMYPPYSGKPSRWRRLQQMADEARGFEWDEISEQDKADGRLFYQKKTWQKIIVMFGGPFMNILIAFCLFWGINAFYGTWQTTTLVANVVACVPAEGAAECAADDPPSPAAEAGLRAGDRIVAWNGVSVSTQERLSELIRANGAGPAAVTVERGGTRVDLPAVNTVVIADPTSSDPGATRAYYGFQASTEQVRGGPVEALGQMWEMTKLSFEGLAKLPVSVVQVAIGMFNGAERGQDTPVSVVGVSAVAGEVAASDQVDAAAKVVLFASLLGSLNLFLAIFNLVPLPPLDGGHIAGALYEGARRQIAKLRRRPDPGHVDTAKALPVTFVVGGFLLLCGIVLMVADIVNPVQLF